MAKPIKFRLGEILVQQNLISQQQLEDSLVLQKQTGRKLGRVLVESEIATEDQISRAIANQLNAPFIDLREYEIDNKVTVLLPETLARRFRALLLADYGPSYLLGMSDPSDIFAYDEIARTLKKDLMLAVVTETQLVQGIDRLYRRTEEITGLARELEKDLGNTYLDFGGLGVASTTEDAPVVKLLQSIFEDASQIRASDVHIEPQESRLQIRFRMDGQLHLQTETDNRIAPALVLRLKLMSGLDISEKRHPQDGRFNIKVKQQAVDVRISTMPTQYGESVVMRILAQNTGLLDLDRLDMPEEMLKRFRNLIHRPNGMVLVTGPTGSGKTTTLYAALNELNTPTRKIITVEDPVEYRLPGISQVQINEKIELSFAKVLRATLRHDPDIILVGEMRDQETAQIGIRAAMTGHLVLSTLHTNDAASTPTRLIDMGVPKYLVTTSLLGVLAQRLVRQICESCKRTHTLNDHEKAWLKHELGDHVEKHEYKQGRGCQHCNDTGYLGRIAVYELMEMSHSMIEALNRHDVSEFAHFARHHLHGRTLRSHAVQRVLAGETTVQEIMRISNQTDE